MKNTVKIFKKERDEHSITIWFDVSDTKGRSRSFYIEKSKYFGFTTCIYSKKDGYQDHPIIQESMIGILNYIRSKPISTWNFF